MKNKKFLKLIKKKNFMKKNYITKDTKGKTTDYKLN